MKIPPLPLHTQRERERERERGRERINPDSGSWSGETRLSSFKSQGRYRTVRSKYLQRERERARARERERERKKERMSERESESARERARACARARARERERERETSTSMHEKAHITAASLSRWTRSRNGAMQLPYIHTMHGIATQNVQCRIRPHPFARALRYLMYASAFSAIGLRMKTSHGSWCLKPQKMASSVLSDLNVPCPVSSELSSVSP